jgi:putative ABC transport system permease protein
MRVGAQSDVQSVVLNEQYETIRTLNGISRDEQGQPLVSPEVVALINIPRKDGKKTNVIVRGVEPAAFKLRPSIPIVEGRMYRNGTNEVIVSRRTRDRFAQTGVGDTIKSGSQSWRVVGIFDAAGSPYDSEIWADLHDVQGQTRRNSFSIVRVRVPDAAARDRFVAAVKGNQQIKMEAKTEEQFYAEQMGTAKPIQFLTYFVGILMAIGASFGAMNTMYAQVSARIREVATLRALGFPRRSILFSFMLESFVLGLIGGAVGAVLATLVVSFVLTAPTGTQNFNTFAEILFNFQMTTGLILSGMIFSVAIGLFGGLFPAARAARLKIINALREV